MEIEEAKKLWTDRIQMINETESLPLFECFGRVTAEDIYSEINVPSFPKSAMDGYAVRSSEIVGASKDNPVVLTVAEEIDAGDVPGYKQQSAASGTWTYPEKSAVRIMTGGMIPEDFDSVVKQEDTDYGEKMVSIYKAIPAFMNYCPVGENFTKGALLAKKGTLINRGILGNLASAGIGNVKVLRKVRAAIINTGSELIDTGEELSPGKIYSSIGAMLKCSVEKAVAETVMLEICPDEKEKIIQVLKKAFEISDIVITSGGVSVGKKDLIPVIINELGGETIFRKVNIQPGTPTMGCIVNGRPLLALSGNPYAALVNFDIYYFEALAKLTGCDGLAPKEGVAVIQSDYKKENYHRRFLRAKESFGKVEIEKDNKASVISNMAECNCYVDVPAGKTYNAGDVVNIIRMPET